MSISRKRRYEAMLEQGMHSGNTDAKFDPPPDPRTINIRVTIAEKKRLTEIAKAAGLSLSAFLRMAALKEAHKILGPPKLVPAFPPATPPEPGA